MGVFQCFSLLVKYLFSFSFFFPKAGLQLQNWTVVLCSYGALQYIALLYKVCHFKILCMIVKPFNKGKQVHITIVTIVKRSTRQGSGHLVPQYLEFIWNCHIWQNSCGFLFPWNTLFNRLYEKCYTNLVWSINWLIVWSIGYQAESDNAFPAWK